MESSTLNISSLWRQPVLLHSIHHSMGKLLLGILSGNELTHNLSGNAPLQSQLAEPLWTDPGLKRGIHLRELISTLKKRGKKAQAGNELWNILPKSLHASKKPPHHHHSE